MKFPYEILVVVIICMHAVECQIKKCPDGFKNTGGNMNPDCVACGPGWADSPKSQNSCLMCGPGLFSQNEWNAACSPCAAGFFSDQASNTACSPCEANSFSNSLSTACVECPLGQIKTASAQCEKCTVGTYSDLGGTKCVPCPNGYTVASGVTRCIDVSASDTLSPSKVAAYVMLPIVVNSLVGYS